jgi:hypothetical protein
MMTSMTSSRAGVAFLLASFGIACGSTGGGGTATDGGHMTDSGASSSSGSSGGSSSGSSSSGGPGDDASSVDGNASDAGEAGFREAGDPSLTLPVNLGTANNFVILAKSGISTVPTSAVTGNIGVSPVTATAITGFGLTADSTNVFSTSPQVTGQVFAANYAVPTPTNLTTAVDDMLLAFTDAAGRAPNVTELGAGDIGGMTLTPGVYKWSSGLDIPTDVTLAGSATSVFIFQIAQNLTMSSAKNIVLTGGAAAQNIFWQVSGSVDLGTTSHFAGVILSYTAIVLETGASIDGRLLSQKAVTIAGSAVVQPAL